MKISIERQGGFFAAKPLRVELDGSALEEGGRARLKRLVALALQAPSDTGDVRRGPDAYRYLVRMEPEGAPQGITINEATAAPELRELLQWAFTLRPADG